MTDVAITGRQIVEDLVTRDVDETVVRHVKRGLQAIAQELRSWAHDPSNEHAGDVEDAADLVDPEALRA